MCPLFLKWKSGVRLRSAIALCCLIFLPALSTCAKKKPPDHPIDLNVANIKELEELPGVGPTTAQAIINFREKSGRIKRVEDLLVIRGISEAKLQKMRPYLTVGAPPPQKSAAAPSSATSSSATSHPPAHTSVVPSKTR
jgi:competence ComEA-like helix-hairpin-helix protein